MIKQILIIFFAILFFGISTLSAQAISNKSVQNGVESFYMADFEAAKSLLQDAVIDAPLSNLDLFYAHLYIAFCNIRLQRDLEAVQLHFTRAIKIRPHMELDPMKIPPDLYDRFITVRNEIITSIVVITQPETASVVVIEPESEAISSKTSPAIFHNLLEGSYQVMVSSEGYHTWARFIQVTPGVIDTLSIVLVQKRKSFFTKMWPYGAGAVAAGAIVYTIALLNKGETETPFKPDLPGPPNRPDQQ
jgi:hypothetical protein